MDTLIKWPGGKKNEIKYIKNLIPSFERYAEPFIGWGALYFDLEYKNSYINDISVDLIQFYSILSEKQSNKTLKKILINYNNYWNFLTDMTNKLYPTIKKTYVSFKLNGILDKDLKENIHNIIENNFEIFKKNFPKNIYLDEKQFFKELERNIVSKIKRTVKLDLKNNFSEVEIKNNIETAIKSSFYMHERYKMNAMKFKRLFLSPEENTANYYFVREYCYGSMFRFNKKGEFNIPYGGLSYNNKNFLNKIERIFSKKSYQLLHNTSIENLDFEEFLNKYQFNENDFIFFDPPYDTNFSDYDTNQFTLKDHERLAKCIFKLDAKFILIIKKTDFIYNLYKNQKNIKIECFDKNYSYNVKGRNDRKVKHLIIHNLKNTQLNLEQF